MAKLEEIQTLKTSGYISLPFSVSWSEDNFLSYITDKGVIVIELIFSGASELTAFSFKQWLIKPHQYIPSYDCLINVAKLGETLPPDELLKLMIDKVMSPMQSLSGTNVFSVSASWSPLCQQLSDTCMLMVLSDQGSLDIYRYGEANWSHMISVSEHWVAHCKKQWHNNKLKMESSQAIVRELKERAYQTKFNSFSWGPCNDESHSILLTGNQLGEIIMWRLQPVKSPDENDKSYNSIELLCLSIYRTNLDSIKSLHCLSLDSNTLMIMTGCLSGKVQCINMSIPSQLDSEDTCNKCVKTKSMVWSDMDQLPVANNGCVGVLLNHGVIYLVPKLGHLLIFWLDTEANLINFTTYSTQDISISGIIWMSGCDFLIITHSGSMFKLCVVIQPDSNTCDVQAYTSEIMNKNNTLSYHGMAASKNRAIFAIPNCLNTYHDTFVIKEATSLCLYKLKSFNHFNVVLNKDLQIPSYHSIWDHIELIRMEFYYNKYQSSIETLPFLEIESDEYYNSLPLPKIKTLYWLYKIIINSLSVQNSNLQLQKLTELSDEFKRVIITHYQLIRVRKMLSNRDDSLDSESLTLSKMWFGYYVKVGRFASYKTKCQEILNQHLNRMEFDDQVICPLCSKKCEGIDSEMIMHCESGHELSRCPVSLKPILGPYYYSCAYCYETTIADGSEDTKTCILCDSPLKQDSQLIREIK